MIQLLLHNETKGGDTNVVAFGTSKDKARLVRWAFNGHGGI